MSEANVINLGKIMSVIKNRMKIIVIIMAISIMIGSYFSFFKSYPSVFEGKTSIIIGNIPTNQNGEDRYYEMLMNQNILNTYTQIAKSSLVAENTANKLSNKIKPQDLSNNIVITPLDKTMVMEIKYTGGESKEVSSIMNAYNEALIETSKAINPGLEVRVLNSPSVAERSGNFNHKLILVNALIIGLVLSIIAAFLLEQRNLSDK